MSAADASPRATTSPIPGADPDRDDPNEYSVVERPLLAQLAAMGWDFIQGDLDDPAITGRSTFRDTILKDRLKAALRRVNRDDSGAEWLDELTLERAVRELLRPDGSGPVEQNQNFMQRLVLGVKVTVAQGSRAGEDVTLYPIAWAPERIGDNEFLAINQFKVLIKGTAKSKRPDVVLFVNGLPLVVIECKSPAITDPMNEALDQLLHYSDQRKLDHGQREGIPELFQFNALMVATDYYHARASTLGDDGTHYAEWKDTAPVPHGQVLVDAGKDKGAPLSSQEYLVAGMLRPAHLLDLVRNFTVWDTEEGRLVKKVARYQQFRAVHKTVAQLVTGKSREQTGNADERGGVIWHTQGSGKSLTMVFLVKKMRTEEALRAFKVVVVTDRTSLEQQLRGTAQLSGQNLRPSKEEARQNLPQTEIVKRILREKGPDLVFCMMQKNQNPDQELERLEYRVKAYERKEDETSEGQSVKKEVTRTLQTTVPVKSEPVEVLNDDPRILLLIDECHRTQAGELRATMMGALPNAAHVGFTGTPIWREGTANTLALFGRFLDKYGMTASWEDGATVEIQYEGRSADGLVEETRKLDEAFDRRFRNYTPAERDRIRKHYGNEPDVMEAPRLIAAKARDMMLHFAGEVMPNGFKAQVVAVSRKAAVRYQQSLTAARDELLKDVEALPAATLAFAPEDLARETEYTQLLVRLYAHRDRLRALEIAAVISGVHTDDPSWEQWSAEDKRVEHERRFKLPFVHDDPAKCSPLGILVVKNMLLTGFDAPVEQALYLDRRMADHELLQAITRVNRKKAGKERGVIVDYAGVADALAAAIKAIRELEEGKGGKAGGITELRELLPRVRDAHEAVLKIFRDAGIDKLLPIDPPVQLLADARIRADFINKLKRFLAGLGAIFTRPEAAEFKPDAKILAFIARVASNVYQDPQLLLMGVEAKVKELVDAYIAAKGINPKIPPTSVMDSRFADEVKKYGAARTKASAMHHAIRLQLAMKMDEDPATYKKLSEKLEAILKELKDRWEEQIKAMQGLIDEMKRADEAWNVEGLEPKLHGPFFGLLREEIEKAGGRTLEADPALLAKVIQLTRDTVAELQRQTRKVDFWRDEASRRQLENWLYQTLRRSRLIASETAEPLATRVMEVAFRRKEWLET